MNHYRKYFTFYVSQIHPKMQIIVLLHSDSLRRIFTTNTIEVSYNVTLADTHSLTQCTYAAAAVAVQSK